MYMKMENYTENKPSEECEKMFRFYLKGLLTILTHLRDIRIPQDTIEHYFFSLNP